MIIGPTRRLVAAVAIIGAALFGSITIAPSAAADGEVVAYCGPLSSQMVSGISVSMPAGFDPAPGYQTVMKVVWADSAGTWHYNDSLTYYKDPGYGWHHYAFGNKVAVQPGDPAFVLQGAPLAARFNIAAAYVGEPNWHYYEVLNQATGSQWCYA